MVSQTTQQPGSNARLLFILSNDYGELGTTIYFLLGQSLASASMILVPQRLYTTNREGLPARVQQYNTLADILKIVEDFQPQLVFLFSGYLYVNNHLLNLKETQKLVKFLASKDCQIVTSDPFLGIPARKNSADIALDIPQQSWGGKALLFLEKQRLSRELFETAQILKEVTHLYAFPCSKFQALQNFRCTSFFNTSLQSIRSIVSDNLAVSSIVADVPSPPYWLFVLANVDYQVQRLLWGEAVFLQLLVNKFQLAKQANRHPVLVAPTACIDALRKSLPPGLDVDLVDFCSYWKFTALSLEAEYVFYWNIISNSILLRMVNQLPVFFFDPGHLVKVMPVAHDLIKEYIYGNYAPQYLNQQAHLSIEELAKLAADYLPQMQAICQYWQHSPTPEQMIQGILQ